MTNSTLTDALPVAADVSITKAVALALAHFGCGAAAENRGTGGYAGLLLPSFTLLYRGASIPVSLEDTTHTLTRRVHFYLDHFPAEASA